MVRSFLRLVAYPGCCMLSRNLGRRCLSRSIRKLCQFFSRFGLSPFSNPVLAPKTNQTNIWDCHTKTNQHLVWGMNHDELPKKMDRSHTKPTGELIMFHPPVHKSRLLGPGDSRQTMQLSPFKTHLHFLRGVVQYGTEVDLVRILGWIVSGSHLANPWYSERCCLLVFGYLTLGELVVRWPNLVRWSWFTEINSMFQFPNRSITKGKVLHIILLHWRLNFKARFVQCTCNHIF